jgi:hypothetical protein
MRTHRLAQAIRLRRVAAGIILLVAAACADALAPVPADGTFVLVSVNGAPLPFAHAQGSATITFLADTLRLSESNGSRRTSAEVTDSWRPVASTETWVVPARFARRDGRLVIEEVHDCDLQSPCSPITSPTVETANELRVERFHGRFSYRRVAP